ncbi:MAG TPA: family 43 glycosylhydrolase [Verrucomicrobiae bacterium]|nr:family 43 glycosylhydrolase [Verrucomicrobiae bacterium]
MLALLLLAFTISCDRSQTGKAGQNSFQAVTINNLEPRRDVTGEIVDAHDGCLQFFNGRFYLYGTAYGNSDGYGVSNRYRVYSSPNLEQWTFEGDLLKHPPTGVYYRPYVAFNPHTRKYVLWYNWYPTKWDGQTGVAVSDTPVGPFTIVNPNVQLSHPNPGDGSLFVDDDGTGYFIYTAIGEGYTVRVERLTPDYLGSTTRSSRILAAGGEAPLLFRRDNTYYAMCGPRCEACPQGSEAQVFTGVSPLGPFITKPQWNINRRAVSGVPNISVPETNGLKVLTPGGTFTLHAATNTPVINATNAPAIPAQETWVAKIPTPDGPVFIWMADRWQSSPDGIKGHDFQFWAPLEFSPEGDILPLKAVSRWSISRIQ